MGNYVLNAQLEDDGFALLLSTKANGFHDNLRNMITSMGGHRRNALKMQGANNASMLKTDDLVAVHDPQIFQIQGLSILQEGDELLSPKQHKQELELLKTFKSEIVKIKDIAATLPQLSEIDATKLIEDLIALKSLSNLELTPEIEERVLSMMKALIEDLATNLPTLAKKNPIKPAFVKELKSFVTQIAKDNKIELSNEIKLSFKQANEIAIISEKKETLSLTLATLLKEQEISPEIVEKLESLLTQLDQNINDIEPLTLKTLLTELKEDLPASTLKELKALETLIVEDNIAQKLDTLTSTLKEFSITEDLNEEQLEQLQAIIATLENGEETITIEQLETLLDEASITLPEPLQQELSTLKILEEAIQPSFEKTLDLVSLTLKETLETQNLDEDTTKKIEALIEQLSTDGITPVQLQTLLSQIKQNLPEVTLQEFTQLDSLLIKDSINETVDTIAFNLKATLEDQEFAPEVTEKLEAIIKQLEANGAEISAIELTAIIREVQSELPEALFEKTIPTLSRDETIISLKETLKAQNIDNSVTTKVEDVIAYIKAHIQAQGSDITPTQIRTIIDRELETIKASNPEILDIIEDTLLNNSSTPTVPDSTPSIVFIQQTTVPILQQLANSNNPQIVQTLQPVIAIIEQQAPAQQILQELETSLAQIPERENSPEVVVLKQTIADLKTQIQEEVAPEQIATPEKDEQTLQENQQDKNGLEKIKPDCDGICGDPTCHPDFKKAVEEGNIEYIRQHNEKKYGKEEVSQLSDQELIQQAQQDLARQQPIVPENLNNISHIEQRKVIETVAVNVFDGDVAKAKTYVEDHKKLQQVDQQIQAQKQNEAYKRAERERDEARRQQRAEPKTPANDQLDSNSFRKTFKTKCDLHGDDCSPELHRTANAGTNIKMKKPETAKRKHEPKIKS